MQPSSCNPPLSKPNADDVCGNLSAIGGTVYAHRPSHRSKEGRSMLTTNRRIATIAAMRRLTQTIRH